MQDEINSVIDPKPNFSHSIKVARLKKHRAGLIIIGLAILAGLGIYNFAANRDVRFGWQEQPAGLVADKISQSAKILINLPDGVKMAASEAKDKISFNPQLLGSWTKGQSEKQLVFNPSTKPDLGKFYRITVISDQVKITKDFQVDEDPRVAAIFPHSESEAGENSEITFVFNRPMVPLTTLDEQLKTSLPIKIAPATDGKFKWVTTRTLKFIPTKRLARSSNYKVSVGKGFVSVEGLEVESFDSVFTTRPLRYAGDTIHHAGATLYDEPVAIRFNQPVDLRKTQGLVEVKDSKTGNIVAFTAEYGSRQVNLGDYNHQADYTDKSVIYIYNRKDRFGRAKFWDNNSNYQVNIKGGVPLEGDIGLTDSRSVDIQVPDLIESVTAQSDRSDLVDAQLFDPKGKLTISFFEDIDKSSTQIKAPNLKSVEYGQKCKLDSDGNQIYASGGNDCQKEDNKKQLALSFKDGDFSAGQNFDVELSKLVNTKGLQLNAENKHVSVNVFPQLQVLNTFPQDGDQSASVTDLVICTNSPLDDAQPENFSQRFKSNITVGKWNWDPAFKVVDQQQASKCAVGQYDNHIRYGLRPQSQYSVELNLVDKFGQTANKKINFTSGKIDTIYYNFNSLQKNYNVTTPQKTKLTYAVENLQYVNLHICQVTAATMLQYLDSETRPADKSSGEGLNCYQAWSKKIDLSEKYWSLNYFRVDLRDLVANPLGYYVLSFSHPQLREQIYDYKTGKTSPGGQIYERTFLNVTNLAAQEKKVEIQEGQEAERSTERKVLNSSSGNLYWVSQIGSLRPVEGAQVQVFQKQKKNYILSDSAVTDSSGVARAKPYSGDGVAVVSKDTDSTLVSSANDKFQWASFNKGGDKTYIYSDRPIYRPTQQVFIKGLYRIGYDGVYEIYKDKTAHLQVFNSNNEPVLTQDLTINSQGTFNTVFNIPSDAPLGSYRVEALGGYYNFDVEEYTPSAFRLDLATDKDEYIAGENFKLNVSANYYFGVPVESGSVEYSVLAQDYYFDRYNDGNFQFGSGWYYSQDPQYGDNFILRGKANLDSSGKVQVDQKLDFDKFFNGDQETRSKIFVVRVTAKNSTGQAVSGEKSFIVHRGEFYLGVNLDKNYFSKDEANKIRIKSVDIQGKEKSVGNISGKINKIVWNYFKRQEVDGSYYYHSEVKKDTVQTFSAGTDGQGNFSQDFKVKDDGEYEVVIQGSDSKGNSITGTQSFYVYGAGSVEVRPLNNDSLDLAVDKSQVKVGDSAKLIIKSPFYKAKALVAIESGRILEYQIVDVDRNFYDYTFHVKEEDIPNVYVTVLLVSPDSGVKFGQTQFFVNSKEKIISVETKADKNSYLPGEQVVLDVITKDSGGKAVSADVSLAAADLSVLALAGNPKKDPVSFFYGGRPLGVTTASNLKNILTEAEIPTGTKGGSGVEPGDLAKKKRGVFKDTAYWNANVQTDENGHAQVKFTLPDNLTTWQVESLGLTADTKLGVGYQEFTAKKSLIVTPLVPRFVIPGDEFVVGGKIFNQTGSAQKLNLTFDSATLQVLDSKQTTINLSSGQTVTVYFKVKATSGMQDGAHKVTISAKNDKFEDTVDSSFPIKRDETYESVTTSNYTTDAATQEYIWLPKSVVTDRGGVSIKTSPTLAGVVPEALNYLVAYPYGCTEQMVSKLVGVATVKRFTSLKNAGDKFKIPKVDFDGQSYSADDVIKIGLQRILSNQAPEGGFAYYPKMKPDFYLTLDVLNALDQLKTAGYVVDQAAVSRAADYVYQTFSTSLDLNSNADTLILTTYTLSNLASANKETSALMPRVLGLGQNSKYFNEDISNLSLTYLALLTAKGQQSSVFQEKVFQTLENRVVVDGRGAYLGAPTNQYLWQYYETPIKDTALLIKAWAQAKRDSPITDKLLRWLKNSRSKDGSWGSTNNTVTVLDALVDYLQFKPETESNFSLEVFLDGRSQSNVTIGSKNIFDSSENFVPVSAFTPDKLSELKFEKKNLNNSLNGFYYDVSLKYYLPVDHLAPRDEGFGVERELYSLDDKAGKTPLRQAKVGDVLRGHLKIILSKSRNFVAVESFIPAGMELVNFNLATSDQSLLSQGQTPPISLIPQPDNSQPVQLSRPGFFARIFLWFKGLFKNKNSPSLSTVGDLPDEVYSGNITNYSMLYPDSTEYHDDRLLLFNQNLVPGVYEYDYYVRALIPGKFQHLPAVASELYTPENFGRTRGEYFVIKQ